MEPIAVPEAARAGRPDCQFVRMGPPRGVKDEDCGTAEMLVSTGQRIPGFSGRGHYAYYRPSPEELELLADGGFIEFAQYGSVVQPFSAVVWPGWEGEAQAAAERAGTTDLSTVIADAQVDRG